MATETLERKTFSVSDHLTSFFLWLAMVDLTVESDAWALTQAQNHFEISGHRAVLSAAPHTGHTDGLFMRRAVAELFPSQLAHLLFLSAKDTWSTPIKRALAELIIGEFYPYDRAATMSVAKAQLKELDQKISGSTEEPGKTITVFPQGTRTPGAPLHHLPVMLAEKSKVPLLLFSIHGAENVFPKVAKHEGNRQFVDALLRRASQGKKDHTPVTIRLEEFIPAHTPRKKAEARFFEVHEQTMSSENS